MSQYDLTFFMGGGRRRIKVYKNKEVTVWGNSVQVLSPGTKICVCKRIYTGDYVCVVPKKILTVQFETWLNIANLPRDDWKP